MNPLKIGIACYPLIGGSGILASALGSELAKRGHEAHFFSYAKPVRLDEHQENVFFHQVQVGKYQLFAYEDYTLPLAARMAEVTAERGLDIIHAHYAVPHATAAYLARDMASGARPRIVTTLHGTDTTLLGKDPIYRRAIEHALSQSDAVTTVSESLRSESLDTFEINKEIQVIPNFFVPKAATKRRQETRLALGVADDSFLFVHLSNLRHVKRIDLLLETIAKSRRKDRFRVAVVAGGKFDEYQPLVETLGIQKNVIVVNQDGPVENYLEAADGGIYTSEKESFCLGILETMFHSKPSVAFSVGGIPEVTIDGETGILAPFGDTDALANALDRIVSDPDASKRMGALAFARAQERFSAERVVSLYLETYRHTLASAK